MILFTCDIDWAPEEVIEDTLDLFREFGVKCTLFATHKSKAIDKCERRLFEIGLHPNFNSFLDPVKKKSINVSAILSSLISLYPEAKGVRSHSLTQGTGIIDQFVKHKLIYDMNLLLPYQENVKPFKLWNGLIRLPYNWEDDTHWLYNYSFSDTNLNLESPLNILNFHPIHIFLNTENEDRYKKAKKFYQNPKKLIKIKNTINTPGTRTLLVTLLKKIKEKNLKSKTVSEYLKI